MIGIYKITSPSKRVYIGQSVNIEKRFNSYKNLKCKGQPIIYNSLKKYGFEKHKFDIICECDISELNDKERYYQDLYSVLNGNGLNCVLTKSTDRSGKKSPESIEKTRQANLGKKHSTERIEKMRQALLGRKMSPESIEKSRQARLGQKMSPESIEKGRIARTGLKRTTEQRERIRQSQLGKKLSKEHVEKLKNRVISQETREKMSKSKLGKKRSTESLEKMSKSQLGLKKRQNTSSEYVGVTFFKNTNKWASSITFNGKKISLGHFENEYDAHLYYKNAFENIKLGLPIEVKRRVPTSKYKGVSLDKRNNKWYASIRINGKQKNLGQYKTELEAHEAYQNKLKSL